MDPQCPSEPDALPSLLPDYLKGDYECGDITCGPGEVCVESCIDWCSDPPLPDEHGFIPEYTCPADCEPFGRHGCYRCQTYCEKVPLECYGCKEGDPIHEECTDSSCWIDYCSESRAFGCWPY
jgi:hypothetical protein